MQMEAGVLFLAVIIAVLICVIFYMTQKRHISKIKENLNQMVTDVNAVKSSMPHYNEVSNLEQNVKTLNEEFANLKNSVTNQMNNSQTKATEYLNETRKLMVELAKEEVVKAANEHLIQNSVSKEEFEKLRERIEGMIGVDEVAERMDVLSSIFDTSKISTLNWQCKLVKLLNGGLAPEAEEDQLTAEGIPLSTYKKFLDKLLENGLIEERQISGYYLLPDFEWIYSYVEKPDWLMKRLENRTKKEREYHEFIRSNLNLIEDGLMLEQDEYIITSGNVIDFICRSKTGQALGIELKYPAATNAVKRQIQGYKREYEQNTGSNSARFMVVAPKIPENLKLELVDDGIEYREINF
jgi:cell fate (sporulation/competence/biofilm development) regulator YlbF (YheA/YmcA/DUF963 family)